MSVRLMSLVFDIPGIPAPMKSILLAMADNAWDDGTSCYPSRGLLEHKTNLGKTTVDVHIRALRQQGWIRKTGETSMGVIEWTINVSKLEENARPYIAPRPYRQAVCDTPLDGTPPTVSRDETISETIPEPVRVVTDPEGTPLPKNKICVRCNARPKAPRARKYCEDCQDLVEQEWNNKLNHMAVRSYTRRTPEYRIQEPQADLIIDRVGSDAWDQKRWANYLDYWLAQGWNIGKAGLGNVLQAFTEKSYDGKLAPERETQQRVSDPSTVDMEDWIAPEGGV